MEGYDFDEAQALVCSVEAEAKAIHIQVDDEVRGEGGGGVVD